MKKARLKKLVFAVLAVVLTVTLSLFCFACSGETVTGPAGEQGAQGEKGEQGDKGATGKSAYEIYLESVSAGETALTKEQWLESLKGANGLDGECTITELNYVNSANGGEVGDKFDKWGIMHRLKITYLNADSEEQTLLSSDSLNIVDQSVFYEAETSDEIWQLMDFNVRRIRLTANILWTGRNFTAAKTDKYYSRIILDHDVEFGMNGKTLTLDAYGITVTNNAAVSFKNGTIQRIERAIADGTHAAGTVSQDKRTVYINATYKDKDGNTLNSASDAEWGIVKEFDEWNGNADYDENNVRKVRATTVNASSNAAVHVNNYCSLKLDTVELYSMFMGIYVDGMSSSVEVLNNSVIECEGSFGIATNAASVEKHNVVITAKDSTIKASQVTSRRLYAPNAFGCGTAVMINVPGSVIIENCILNGTSQALITRGGHSVVRNSVLSANGVHPNSLSEYNDKTSSNINKFWNTTNGLGNFTVVVGNASTNTYQYAADCTLTNCEIIMHENAWGPISIAGNKGDGNGYKDGEWIGATLTYDAMTFSRSGDVDMHVHKFNANNTVHRPEMLLNANEWYEADTQQKIADLMDYGATNIRLTADLSLEANVTAGENAGYTVISNDMNIGLNGHTITVNSKGLKIANNSEVQFRNGVVLMNKSVAPEELSVNGNYAIEVGEFCNLELEAVKLYANRSGVFLNGKAASLDMWADSAIYACGYYGIGTNVNGSKDFGVIINVKYSKVFAGLNEFAGLNGVTPVNLQNDSDRYGVAVLLNVPGTLKAEKTSYLAGYTHGLVLREGTAVINNSVVEVTGSNSKLDKYSLTSANHAAWGKGYNVPSAAITLGTYQTPAENGGSGYLYSNATEVILTNTTLKKTARAAYICMHNDNEKENTSLTFDTFTAWKSLGNDNKNAPLVTLCDKGENDKLAVWDGRKFSAAA